MNPSLPHSAQFHGIQLSSPLPEDSQENKRSHHGRYYQVIDIALAVSVVYLASVVSVPNEDVTTLAVNVL